MNDSTPTPGRLWSPSSRTLAPATLLLGALILVMPSAVQGIPPVGPTDPDPETGEVVGRALDSSSMTPIQGAVIVLGESELRAITDGDGRFRFADVPAGRHHLELRHLAYGEQGDSIEVVAGERLELDIMVSPTAIELAAISVVARTPEERARRAGGAGSNVITREQFEALKAGGNTLADAMRIHMPGASVREGRAGRTCVEFRSGRAGRGGQCNAPRVIVDNLPLTEPGYFFRSMPLEDLERVEYLPANQATARYGDDASYGALVVTTRRAHAHGIRGGLDATPSPRIAGFPAYDWDLESASHNPRRTFLGAALGTLAGVGAAMVVQDCITIEERIVSDCGSARTRAALGSVIVLPIAGATAGTRIFGATDESHGRLLPTAIAAAVPLALGFGLTSEGMITDLGDARWLGAAIMTLGTPALTTLIDGLIRTRRDSAPPREDQGLTRN